MNPDLSRLFVVPIGDQLRLVEDLWDHIGASKEPLPVPGWQKQELDRRKRAFEANPDSAIPWDEAMTELRQQ